MKKIHFIILQKGVNRTLIIKETATAHKKAQFNSL
jgi:hypothetical protein